MKLSVGRRVPEDHYPSAYPEKSATVTYRGFELAIEEWTGLLTYRIGVRATPTDDLDDDDDREGDGDGDDITPTLHYCTSLARPLIGRGPFDTKDERRRSMLEQVANQIDVFHVPQTDPTDPELEKVATDVLAEHNTPSPDGGTATGDR